MLVRNIGFDMTVDILTEIFHSDLQQVKIITVYNAVSFLSVSLLPVPVRLLKS